MLKTIIDLKLPIKLIATGSSQLEIRSNVQEYLTGRQLEVIVLPFWCTKVGAEVDFVFYKNQQQFIPIEVKYQNMQRPKITRGFRSFLEAYQPPVGVIITQSLIATLEIAKSKIYFIPIEYLDKLFGLIRLVVKD